MSIELTELFHCLCDETRLRMLNLLISGPLCTSHFQEALSIPQVKVSKHLAYLRERKLVECERIQNWTVYSLPKNPPLPLRHQIRCLEDCRHQYPQLSDDLSRLLELLPTMRVPASDTGETFSDGDPFRILFLCTGNSARSIIAEFLTRKFAGDRFESFSAGSEPRPDVNPLALCVLRDDYRIDTAGARSKSWTEFESSEFDFLITLCDRARESCPAWKGRPITAHWDFEDPAAFEGPETARRKVFSETAKKIETRLKTFTGLALETLDRLRLEHSTRAIGLAPSRTSATSRPRKNRLPQGPHQ